MSDNYQNTSELNATAASAGYSYLLQHEFDTELQAVSNDIEGDIVNVKHIEPINASLAIAVMEDFLEERQQGCRRKNQTAIDFPDRRKQTRRKADREYD